MWREKAFREWRRLEKYQRGVMVLDELVKREFWMEKVLWERKLGKGRNG